jgi:hypothetical protein
VDDDLPRAAVGLALESQLPHQRMDDRVEGGAFGVVVKDDLG